MTWEGFDLLNNHIVDHLVCYRPIYLRKGIYRPPFIRYQVVEVVDLSFHYIPLLHGLETAIVRHYGQNFRRLLEVFIEGCEVLFPLSPDFGILLPNIKFCFVLLCIVLVAFVYIGYIRIRSYQSELPLTLSQYSCMLLRFFSLFS